MHDTTEYPNGSNGMLSLAALNKGSGPGVAIGKSVIPSGNDNYVKC